MTTTDFLGFNRPPFLSRTGFRGQLKSPPIIMFSSSSKLFFLQSQKQIVEKVFDISVFVASVNVDQNIHFVLNLCFQHDLPSQGLQNFGMYFTINALFKKDCHLTGIGTAMGHNNLTRPFIFPTRF